MQETLSRALALARKGQSREAADEIQPLIADEKTRPVAAAALAACWELAGDYAKAIYLYREALRLRPDTGPWKQYLARCEESWHKRVRDVGSGKPGAALLVLFVLFSALGGVVAGSSVPGLLADLSNLLLEFDSVADPFPPLAAGAALGLIAFLFLAVWVPKRIRHAAAVRWAKGEDFSDRRHTSCWNCGLRYGGRLRVCPYCTSPRSRPKTAPTPGEDLAAEPAQITPVPPARTPANASDEPVLLLTEDAEGSEEPPLLLAEDQGPDEPALLLTEDQDAALPSQAPQPDAPAARTPPGRASVAVPNVRSAAAASVVAAVLAVIAIVLGVFGVAAAFVPRVSSFSILPSVAGLLLAAAALGVSFVGRTSRNRLLAAVALGVCVLATAIWGGRLITFALFMPQRAEASRADWARLFQRLSSRNREAEGARR